MDSAPIAFHTKFATGEYTCTIKHLSCNTPVIIVTLEESAFTLLKHKSFCTDTSLFWTI